MNLFILSIRIFHLTSFLFFLPLLTLAQGHICNPGFENPELPNQFPSARAQGDKLECWKTDQFINPPSSYHSPDWFYVNSNNTFLSEDRDGDGELENILGNNQSLGYLGMSTCELIQQDANSLLKTFEKDIGYIVSFFLRIPDPVSVQTINGTPISSPGGTVKFQLVLSKYLPEYENPTLNCANGSTFDHCSNLEESGTFGQNYQEISFEINLDDLALGEWIRVSFPFFISEKNFDHFTIQTISKNSTSEDCSGYVLIDDFEVLEFPIPGVDFCLGFQNPDCRPCSHVSNPIAIGVKTNPLTPSTALTLTGLSNASSFTYFIRDIQGQLLFGPVLRTCANGWHNGEAQIDLPTGMAVGNYYVELVVVNSCGLCKQSLSFNISSTYQSQFSGCNCRPTNVPLNCCLNFLSAEQYQNPCNLLVDIEVISDIGLGVSESFQVFSGDMVLVRAANSIRLGNGFHVSPNSSFRAIINACSPQANGNAIYPSPPLGQNVESYKASPKLLGSSQSANDLATKSLERCEYYSLDGRLLKQTIETSDQNKIPLKDMPFSDLLLKVNYWSDGSISTQKMINLPE